MTDFTVILEATTGDITGVCDTRRNLLEWAAEAAAALPARGDVLVVAPAPVTGLDSLEALVPVRQLVVPKAGYYALKNAGAAAARGEILIFSDADCRPSRGYVTRMLEAFEDPGVACVAGRSVYDGGGFLTRLNSVHSFGELHCGQAALDRGMVLTHNVGLRKDRCGELPFGPFAGRVGGDRYLTDRMRAQGRVALRDDLVIRHEDISYSLRGTVERHLRETFVPLGYGGSRQRFSPALTAACALVLRPALRARRLLRAGPRLGIGPLHWPLCGLVQLAYWAFDLACVATVLCVPPLRRRWLAFQHGQTA